MSELVEGSLVPLESLPPTHKVIDVGAIDIDGERVPVLEEWSRDGAGGWLFSLYINGKKVLDREPSQSPPFQEVQYWKHGPPEDAA